MVAHTPETLPVMGNWKMIESENFEELMKEVGVNVILRKAALHLKPSFELYIDDKGIWHMDQRSTFRDHFLQFELGKELDATTPDGRVLRTLFYVEGDRFYQRETKIKANDKDALITRYVNDEGKLITIIEVGKVVCRRVYVRA